MKLLVTGISALELWDKGIGSRAVPVNCERIELFEVDAYGLQMMQPNGLGISSPGHLLVPARGPRPYNARWHCHTWGDALPPGTLFQVNEWLFIVSPAFAFYQLAKKIGYLDAIKLGMEMCGGYSTLVPWGRPCRDRPPLCSREQLQLQLGDMLRGDRSVAMRAVQQVVDGSASPMETAGKMMLCLPRRFGCPGFPQPQMNQKVALNSDERRALGKGFLRCDLKWGSVGVEYKGMDAHTGDDNLAADTARENVLALKGITVISITYASLKSAEEFQLVCKLLAKHLGRRLRIPPDMQESYLAAQEQTRAVVLRNDTCSWVM